MTRVLQSAGASTRIREAGPASLAYELSAYARRGAPGCVSAQPDQPDSRAQHQPGRPVMCDLFHLREGSVAPTERTIETATLIPDELPG
mgnify:CR=1 FL=1